LFLVARDNLRSTRIVGS